MAQRNPQSELSYGKPDASHELASLRTVVPNSLKNQCASCLPDMQSSAYHLLSKLPAAPRSLSDALRTTTLAAGHVAAGDVNATIEAFRAIPQDSSCRDKAFDLAVLQACPIVGFPRALTAAVALQQAGLISRANHAHHTDRSQVADNSLAADAHAELGVDSSLVGSHTFDSIYGRVAGKVRDRIARCHPLLETWMIRFAYGDVLSRPEATLRERELCLVAMLAGGGSSTQSLLVSHCRGALRMGATKDELRAVLDHTELVHGSQASEIVEAVWYTMDRARNIL